MITEIECNESDLKNICKLYGDHELAILNEWKVKMYEKGNEICSIDDHWKLGRQIGEKSMFGSAHLANCKRKNGDIDEKTYIFKIVELPPGTDALRRFNREVSFQIEASKLGVASPIYQVFINKKNTFGMFVMDKYEMTIQTYFKNELQLPNPDFILLRKMYDRCVTINKILETKGIFHNDQHLDNFMLKSMNPIDIQDIDNNVKIIDFGDTDIKPIENDVMSKKIKLVSIPELLPCVKEKNEFLSYILPDFNCKPVEIKDEFKLFTKELNEFYDDINNYIDDYENKYTDPKKMEKYKTKFDTYMEIMNNYGFDYMLQSYESRKEDEDEKEDGCKGLKRPKRRSKQRRSKRRSKQRRSKRKSKQRRSKRKSKQRRSKRKSKQRKSKRI